MYAGDIAAAVGLRSVRPATRCATRSKPIVLESMDFPEPVISLAIEPKTKADQEKLGHGPRQADGRGSDVPREDRRADRPGRHRRHGRAAPRDHRRPPEARVQRRGERRQAAGRLQGNADASGRRRGPVRASRPAAAASTATRRFTSFRGEPGTGYDVRERDRRRLDSEGVHQADRPGHQGSDHARRPRRLPGGRCGDRAVRRVVPRRGLVGNGVQDRRLDGVPGCREEGEAGAARAGDARRGRRARRITWAT